MNRRAFLSAFLPARTATQAADAGSGAQLAIIAGRHCLAYTGSFCSVCRERCPVPGAVVIERGLPRIDPAACTGCRICHEVCPAPMNAVRMIPRPSGGPLALARTPR
jgi:MinD superfamily P-loop ATPase